MAESITISNVQLQDTTDTLISLKWNQYYDVEFDVTCSGCIFSTRPNVQGFQSTDTNVIGFQSPTVTRTSDTQLHFRVRFVTHATDDIARWLTTNMTISVKADSSSLAHNTTFTDVFFAIVLIKYSTLVSKPTLRNNKYTYTGNAITITASDFTSFDSSAYSITSGASQTNPGAYGLTITCNERYKFTDLSTSTTIDWEIWKYFSRPQLIKTSTDYNGLWQSPDGTWFDTFDTDDLMIAVSTERDAGTYTADLMCKGFREFTGGGGTSWTFYWYINKIDCTYTVTLSQDIPYDGQSHQIATATCSGGTITLATSSSEWAFTAPPIYATNAQTYTIYYKIVGDKNHKDVSATYYGDVRIYLPQWSKIKIKTAQGVKSVMPHRWNATTNRWENINLYIRHNGQNIQLNQW